jgi:hypothetical protein
MSNASSKIQISISPDAVHPTLSAMAFSGSVSACSSLASDRRPSPFSFFACHQTRPTGHNQVNIMKQIKLTIAALCLCASVVLFTGCSTTNRQQIINSTSGDGVQAKVAVPIGSAGSIGVSLFVGRMNSTTVVQPTSTNGPVNAPSMAIVVAGAGKQGVNGSTGVSTNSAAGITDGSRDASIIVTGPATASGTNASFTITGNSGK